MTTSLGRGYHIPFTLEQCLSLETVATETFKQLQQISLIEIFGEIAHTHGLSAPVVATMRANSMLMNAVREFPATSLFSIIPEHATSINQTLGVESLTEAAEVTVSELCQKTSKLACRFGGVLDNLGDLSADFVTQLLDARNKLTALEVPEDAISDIPVFTYSAASFVALFDALEHYLKELPPFDSEKLRGYPEGIAKEIDTLVELIADVGPMLGIAISEYGIYNIEKAEQFLPSSDTLADKGLSKALLIDYLTRAVVLCETLEGLANQSEELKNAVCKEAADIPPVLNSTELQYGANEHITFLTCYCVLTCKFIREAVVVMSRLLATVDPIVVLGDDEPTTSSGVVETPAFEDRT